MTLNTYLYRGHIYITFLSICPVSNHKNASKRRKYPKQWLHKRNKQTRSHTESIVLYLRRICVCPGVFIYFGVGAACGWIVWVCLCCVSFLFGVFKETQHSKCLCSLSFLKELWCVAAVLNVRCGFWHSFELKHRTAMLTKSTTQTEIWHCRV